MISRNPAAARALALLARIVSALPMLAAITAASPAEAQDASAIVACYDAGRQLVTHVLPDLCKGEVISAAREADFAAARRRRIAASIRGERARDPVTGTDRLIGTGSGFYVSAAGDLLTNDHVINRCSLVTATSDDGGKIAARIVATSRQPDLALLRTDRPPPGIARFSRAPERSDGLRLAVVGYPAYGLPTRFSTLATAQIEPVLLATEAPRVQFHGEIRHGNSGSPLLDQSGDVLGVVYATIDSPRVFAATGKLVTDIGVAISYRATLRFLGANAVTPLFADGAETPLATEKLHEKSRSFVVQIGCWK